MEKIFQELINKGVAEKALREMDEDTVRNLAKAFGLSSLLPRSVKIVKGNNGALYVSTNGYSVQRYRNNKPVPGETTLARNLFIRVDALDEVLADLIQAQSMLSKLNK